MKISVIIPTRERAVYLKSSIRTALAVADRDLEVIVSNNASTDDTRAVVEEFSDSRLIYLETGNRVSMRENFNRALCKSSGDYVLFIGDDDAVLPGQFSFLRRILQDHRPDGVSWFKATYGWPVPGYGGKTGGVRFYRQSSFGAPVGYDPQDNSAALLSARLSQLNPSPNIYHGCASRAYLDKIAPQDGIYFDSAIPDVNFEYRTTLRGGRFLHADHAFTINGYGPVSTGGAHSQNDPGSENAKAGAAFVAENRADPLEDVMDHALCIQLALFATLETLRSRAGLAGPAPDYESWYHYALAAGRRDPDRLARVNAILQEYSMRNGTMAQLAAARRRAPHAKRTLGERVARAKSQFNSFRLSAAQDGQNTVKSAARVYDAVLGQDFGAVMDGAMTRSAAWRAARQRAAAFTRQL
jgi:glycosyltransferase involved in cell wall biosynthesis